MEITILGWLLVGIVIGATAGVVGMSMKMAKEVADLESQLYESKAIREALKEEIFRIDNRPKPKPRKRRKISK
tara:strand:+ start:1057 stop:1275 length:219 start_codon:yes stop_codon:yes gene_type:complete